MATFTKNLNLTKPEVTDNITPEIFADNFEIIDEAISDRMSNSGGTFEGDVKAYEEARTTRGLYNNETRSGNTSGSLQAVKYFIDVTAE